VAAESRAKRNATNLGRFTPSKTLNKGPPGATRHTREA